MISRQSRLADVFAPGLQKTSGEARKKGWKHVSPPLSGGDVPKCRLHCSEFWDVK